MSPDGHFYLIQEDEVFHTHQAGYTINLQRLSSSKLRSISLRKALSHFCALTPPQPKPHPSPLSAKETSSKQAGFSPCKTPENTNGANSRISRDTPVKNARNRPVVNIRKE